MSKSRSFLRPARNLGILLASLLSACDRPPPSFQEEMFQDSFFYEAKVENKDTDSVAIDSNDHTAADLDEDEPEQLTLAVASWKFQATLVESASVALDVNQGHIEQRFQMAQNVIPQRLEFQQVNRPVVTETFRQGTEQEFKTETFAQSAAASGLLDLLVVIDSSGSMKEEQSKLSSKLLPLLQYLKDADWRIGVVTTDPIAGCLSRLISKGDSNAAQVFAESINAGISGSGNERGLLQAVNGLKGECNPNGSWLRTQSTVAVLIVSDEDNCSLEGQDCGSDPWAKSDYLVHYLDSIRKVGVNARTYGILWHPTMSQNSCRTASHPAPVYAEAIERSGGTWGSICDSDYASTLRSISYDLSVILQTQFALQNEPDPSTLQVFVNNRLKSSGYRLIGNVLEFLDAPALGAEIKVDYKFSSVPPQSEFFLGQGADSLSLKVYLDGVPTNQFRYDQTAQSVRFEEAPLVDEVKVIYRSASGLKTDFRIGQDAGLGSVRVAVNGRLTRAFSYSAATGLVHMNNPPGDQALISVSFDQVLRPKLIYPVYAAVNARNQIRVADAITRELLPFQVEGDHLVFQRRDFQALRNILVVYPATVTDSLTVDLVRDALPGSVSVQGLKSGPCEEISLAGRSLDMSACPFQASESILIRFKFVAEHRKAFDLGSLDLDLTRYRWTILVNGAETNDYTFSQGQIKFPLLPLEATVEARLFKIIP